MSQATVSRARRKVRAFAFVVPVLAYVALAGACAENKRAEGDDCLKDEDCLSGYCVQLHCGSAPTYTDAQANADGAVPIDAASDAPGPDGSNGDAPAEAASEAGGGPDAPVDAPQDTGSGGG
jgi:hypothetical protein